MIVQPFMCLHTHHIIPVEQPVQLLTRQRDDRVQCLAGPFKLRPFQGFLPQAVTVAFPVQDFDLVTLAVTEYKQFIGEWIQFKLLTAKYIDPLSAISFDPPS